MVIHHYSLVTDAVRKKSYEILDASNLKRHHRNVQLIFDLIIVQFNSLRFCRTHRCAINGRNAFLIFSYTAGLVASCTFSTLFAASGGLVNSFDGRVGKSLAMEKSSSNFSRT